MYNGMKVHRALVTNSSATTGEVSVKIPAVLGESISLPVSFIGRAATDGAWVVPNIGDQVLVAVENDRFSNVFMVPPFTKSPEVHYVSAYDTTTQTNASANSVNTLKINTVDIANGITIDEYTNIHVSRDGVYNLHNGERRDHNPDELLSKITTCSPAGIDDYGKRFPKFIEETWPREG